MSTLVASVDPPIEVVHSGRRRTMRRLTRDVAAVAAMVVLVLLMLMAVVGAPLAAHLTGHPPNKQFADALSIDGLPIGIGQRPYMADGITTDPNASIFVLGADRLGRDQLVRLCYGARVSLIVAFGATGLAMIIGIGLGLLAGSRRGWVDGVISRLVEISMSFPTLLLAVGLAVVVGPGLINVLVIIALFTWFYPARIVRNATIGGSQLLYVDASRAIGARHGPRPARARAAPDLGSAARLRHVDRRRRTSSSRPACRTSAWVFPRRRRAGVRCCLTG